MENNQGSGGSDVLGAQDNGGHEREHDESEFYKGFTIQGGTPIVKPMVNAHSSHAMLIDELVRVKAERDELVKRSPMVYVSVSGGVADAILCGVVEMLEIDWDNMRDDDCDLETLESTIQEVRKAIASYPNIKELREAESELLILIERAQ